MRSRVAAGAIFALALAVAACSGGKGVVPANGIGAGSTRHVAARSDCIKGYVGAGGVPFHVVDDSGLAEKDADTFNLYVTVDNSTQYLDRATGALKPLTTATIAPIPVKAMCPDFQLPPGVASRAYISFGPLSVNNSPPNPKSPNDPNNHVLYDWMEFGTPAGSVYNFQADMFGLPLQATMRNASDTPYAFGYNHYDTIIAALNAEPWRKLFVCGDAGTNHSPECPAGKFIVRIQAPGSAAAPGGTGFPSYWTDYGGVDYLTKLGTAFNAAPKGAIVYVAYQISYPNPKSNPAGIVQGCGNFPGTNAGLPCPGYTVAYDADARAFTFTLASPAPPEYSPTPEQQFPQTVTLPIKEYFSDYDIWAQPAPKWVPSTPGPGGATPTPIANLPMKEQVEFYLLKDMYIDLNRGVAETTGTVDHPAYHAELPNCMPTPIAAACVAHNYYKAIRVNAYSAALHDSAVDIYAVTKGDPLPVTEPGTAYGFPYDDEWSQSSSVTPAGTIKCLQIRILPMAGTPAQAKTGGC